MDRQARKMLNYIVKVCAKESMLTLGAFYTRYQKHCGMHIQHVMACVRFLIAEGYLEVGTSVYSDLPQSIWPSFTAVRRRSIAVKRAVTFALCNILLPIVVSTVTTLVTLWIAT